MISYQKNKLEINGQFFVLDYPIKKVLQIKDFVVVLLDPDSYTLKFGQFPNLRCYDAGGSFRWTAELPTNYSGEHYYDIYIENEKIMANSFSFSNCEIDISSGNILNLLYNK
jgi:hypothetical protein